MMEIHHAHSGAPVPVLAEDFMSATIRSPFGDYKVVPRDGVLYFQYRDFPSDFRVVRKQDGTVMDINTGEWPLEAFLRQM